MTVFAPETDSSPQVGISKEGGLELALFCKPNTLLLNYLKNSIHRIHQIDDVSSTSSTSTANSQSYSAILFDTSLETQVLSWIRTTHPTTPIIAILDVPSNLQAVENSQMATSSQDQSISELFALGISDYLEPSELNDTTLAKTVQKAIHRTSSNTPSVNDITLSSITKTAFHQNLNDLIQYSLQEGLSKDAFSFVLEKAISAIPGAEAGSLMLLREDNLFHFVATVGYDFQILKEVKLKPDEIYGDVSNAEPSLIFEVDDSNLESNTQKIFNKIHKETPLKVALSIPLSLEGKTFGLFNLDNFSNRNAFDEDTIDIAKLFGNQFEALWQRYQTEKSLRQEQQSLKVESSFRAELNTLISEIFFHTQSEAVYQTMLEKAVDTIPGAQAGSMAILTKDGYRFVAAVGFKLDILASTVFELEDFRPPKNWSQPTLKSYFEEDWHRLDKHKQDIFINAGPSGDIFSSLSIPILKNGEVVIIFNLDNLASKDAFTDTSISMGQIFATHIEALWERIQLEDNLRKDQTRLINESSFRAELNTLMSDVLSQDSDEEIYQAMLEKAVDIIPNVHAGSMIILTPKGYQYVAAVEFKLDILSRITFDYEDFGEPVGWSKPVVKDYFTDELPKVSKEKQEVFINAGNGQDIQASLSIPVVRNGHVVIIFNLDNFEIRDAFDETTISMSQMFATQIEALWQRLELEKNLKKNEQRFKKLFVEADRTNKELELLDKVQHAIANKLELSDLYETVTKTIANIFNFSTVVIGLLQGDNIVRVATHGQSDKNALMVLPIDKGITAKVMKSQKPELVEILSKHPDTLNIHTQRNSSLLAMPFFINQEILGILYIENSSRILKEHDLELIQKVIDQLELAIENAQLHAQVKTDLARSHALQKISTSIQTSDNLKDLTQQVIQTTREAVGARWAILYKLDFQNKLIEHIVTSELSESPLTPLTFEQLQDGLTGWAIEHQEMVSISKGKDDPREHPHVKEARLELEFGSVIVSPLIYQNEALGVIALINHIDDSDYTESDIQMVRQVSNQASIALAQHQLKQKIEYQAYHDVVTGLPNRFLFEDRLKQTLTHAKRYSRYFAVLFLDLDGFKHINDTLGHDAGDVLLQEVSKRLSNMMRESDTLARMGGDEFAVIIDELRNSEDALQIAQSYQVALQQSFTVDGNTLFINGSVGISMYPKDGQDISTLIKHADTAMYEAKALGKNRVQSFTQVLADRTRERLELETHLRTAIEENSFKLYYQPKIDLQNRQCMGAEALIRWIHPELGFVSPEKFIPIAEETGLITPLGDWIIDEACRQIVAWHKEGLAISVAVNISSVQFQQFNFVSNLKQALENHNLSSEYLELEVTESMIMEDIDIVIQRLQELRELGVTISIDDFGTGYSSLSYLQKLPLDNLKIDRSFVDQMDKHEHQKNLVQTIISMAENFDLEVIAEGVETEPQLEMLLEMGCQIAQGYYFAKPLPANEATKVIKAMTSF